MNAAAYCNGDDVFLAWTLPDTQDCWGVAIWRDIKRTTGEQDGNYLWNYTGFEGGHAKAGEHATKPTGPAEGSR